MAWEDANLLRLASPPSHRPSQEAFAVLTSSSWFGIFVVLCFVCP